jgi:uncharacterized protein
MKRPLKGFLLASSLVLLIGGGVLQQPQPGHPFTARAYAPEVMAPTAAPVNLIPPAPIGPAKYVQDGAGMLSQADKQLLLSVLSELNRKRIAQICVLIVPDSDQSLAEFAPRIMNTWGIGHKSLNNGVLILVNASRVKQNKRGDRIFVATGQGVQGVLPDGKIGRILDQVALPAFQQAQYSQGITKTTLIIASLLQKGLPSGPVKSMDNPAMDVAIAAFIFMIIFSILRRFKRYTSGLPYEDPTLPGGGWYFPSSGGGSSHGGSGWSDGGGFDGGGSDGGGAGR